MGFYASHFIIGKILSLNLSVSVSEFNVVHPNVLQDLYGQRKMIWIHHGSKGW
jgi:hypothetical protein